MQNLRRSCSHLIDVHVSHVLVIQGFLTGELVQNYFGTVLEILLLIFLRVCWCTSVFVLRFVFQKSECNFLKSEFRVLSFGHFKAYRHGYPVYFEMELFLLSKRTLFLREFSAILAKTDLKVAYENCLFSLRCSQNEIKDWMFHSVVCSLFVWINRSSCKLHVCVCSRFVECVLPLPST